MNNNNDFWVCTWAVLAVFGLGLIAICSAHYEQNHQDIITMVQEGFSPIEAACALDDSRGGSPTCVALVARK